MGRLGKKIAFTANRRPFTVFDLSMRFEFFLALLGILRFQLVADVKFCVLILILMGLKGIEDVS